MVYRTDHFRKATLSDRPLQVKTSRSGRFNLVILNTKIYTIFHYIPTGESYTGTPFRTPFNNKFTFHSTYYNTLVLKCDLQFTYSLNKNGPAFLGPALYMKKSPLPPPEITAKAPVVAPSIGMMQPGVIILNRAGKLLYLNLTAKDFLNAMQEENGSSIGENLIPPPHSDVFPIVLDGKKGETSLPYLLTELHRDFQKKKGRDIGSAYNGSPAARPVFIKNNLICFVRAFLLQNSLETPQGAYLLILIEALPSTYNTPMAPFAHLTEREKAVVRLLFKGKTNKEVAISMEISEHTVKEHLKRIMKKLNVTNRAGIVAHFVQPIFSRQEKKFRNPQR